MALAFLLVLGALLTAVVLQAHAAGAEPLLPNLVADPPDNVSLATDSSTGVSRLLLRFNGYVHNQGPGTLDFRGSRAKPNVSAKVEGEVEHAREKQEGLSQKVEEELASPPMKVSQRLFTTNAGNPEESEKYIERPHVDEPSSGEMIYVSADGHHHWHLQRVAAYSLWNASKTAEVAPAQKVGFCLEDSQHVETGIGPAKAVYADNVAPFRDFCQQYRPNATGVYEGISPGWRDLYDSSLAFQWVDASNVLPGEYWLREDVNPLGVIKEAGGANTPAYATTPTIIPGFDALAQLTSAQTGQADTVTLTSKAWGDSAIPKYTIATQPQHGKLGVVSNNQVIYTPNPGYVGPDSFTYSAADPNSQFPTNPAVATVSIEVTAAVARGLLVGDGTSTYAVGDQTSTGREEAFQFTAKSGGTVEELQFRTDTVANTGVTGMTLGVLAEGGGKPGVVLGQGTVSGEPAVSSWVRVSGLSVPVVSGTKYWLVVLPLGPSGKKLHFNAAAATGGAGNVESLAAGLTALTAEASWETYNQGPAGFQAIGSSGVAATVLHAATQTDSTGVAVRASIPVAPASAQPDQPQSGVAMAGAPARITAGTSVQLSATVANGSPGDTWSASAGSIDASGLYTAPAVPPAGGAATIVVRSRSGARDQRTLVIAPVPTAEPAPAASTVAVEALSSPEVLRPEAMLVGHALVLTTTSTAAGRVRLSAYLGKRRLGSCVTQTPADRSFTCRLTLGKRVSLETPLSAFASLRIGGEVLRNVRRAEPVPRMKMNGAPNVSKLFAHGHLSASWQFMCSPSMAGLR